MIQTGLASIYILVHSRAARFKKLALSGGTILKYRIAKRMKLIFW